MIGKHRRELSVAAAYLLVLAFLAWRAPGFYRLEPWRAFAVGNASVLVAAVGMTLVILARQIDISVGSQASICAVVAGLLAKSGLPMPLVGVGTLLAGAGMGAINGGLVAGLGLPSIVVTLATLVIGRESLRYAREGAFVRGLPGDFQWFGAGQGAGQWFVVGIALVVFVAFAWGMRYLAMGRSVYATGSDPEAARLAGIRPKRVVFSVFVMMGALTGLYSLLNVVQFPAVDPKTGTGLEMQVIAAVVVGGVAVSGGRGTLTGTLIGVLLLGTINPALVYLHTSAEWEKAIQGAIILLAVASDGLTRGRIDMAMSSASPAPIRIDPAQAILLALIAAEVVLFSAIGTNFLTLGNGFEVLRLSVEIGLLAVALTPVIVGGGIDLSVGSLMGLSAVLFGTFWRDLGLPIVVAAPLTLLVGAVAGGLNGSLVTRLRIPALIVTLGSFSLFRGLAEGWTGGVDNFTNFPSAFLFLGQGYLPGDVPTQLPVFLLVAAASWVLLHRTTTGRSLFAIGFSPEGARYAGLPVDRLVALTYVLSGVVSSLAAIIYVSHLGQAKADAGTGYELLAITAVVLGGTSIFGGRGSIGGTLLGLLAIAILQNGMRLADLPAELAGVLTGTLLLLAIGLDRRTGRVRSPSVRPTTATDDDGVMTVKNTQVAMICASILAAGLIVAGTNIYLLESVHKAAAVPAQSEKLKVIVNGHQNLEERIAVGSIQRTIAMMPKSKGNAYFIACRKGAEVAANEMGVKLIWDGPTDPDPAKQNDIVDTWITRGVDAIAVAVENREGISSVLRKARAKGIKVVTWDADADPDARDLFVNQATPRGIGEALMDNAARVLGGKGEFAIITASLTAANMIAWQKEIEIRRAAKYPDITLVALRPCDDLQKKAFDETNTLLSSNPNIKLIMAICTPAVPGAAEAIKQSGRADVKVVGLGLPNDNKAYVHDGITDTVILWNTADLGYLAVLTAKAVVEGRLKAGDPKFQAGRLGAISLEGDNVLLGKPFSFTKDNIEGFDF